jgi:hypothetical protein
MGWYMISRIAGLGEEQAVSALLLSAGLELMRHFDLPMGENAKLPAALMEGKI